MRGRLPISKTLWANRRQHRFQSFGWFWICVSGPNLLFCWRWFVMFDGQTVCRLCFRTRPPARTDILRHDYSFDPRSLTRNTVATPSLPHASLLLAASFWQPPSGSLPLPASSWQPPLGSLLLAASCVLLGAPTCSRATFH